uniref:BHLH domain-containing protein n=1 Tax=Periophthalmus magnuspinnatus TaxID=409849 RepID=A0A3B3ZKV5_9GOBI
MEFNSLLILLEAAEYLERRDREAEHGYASVLPFTSDFSRKKTKPSPITRKAQNNRRAKLRLYLEQLKKLVPLGPDSTRHTTLSLLKRAKMHIKKLEEQDRKALNMKEQLQREHRYLKRRLEQLSVSGSVERIRTDSMGSTISTDSEQEVDIEGMEFTPVEVDSVDSVSEVEEEEEEDHYSLQSSSSSDSYTATHSHRLQPFPLTTTTAAPPPFMPLPAPASTQSGPVHHSGTLPQKHTRLSMPLPRLLPPSPV